MPHERLRTVMPGPDRHALFVQYGADIMRMHPLDLETQYAGAVLRPEGADAVEAGQGLPRLPHQRTFMSVDHIKTDAFHLINGPHHPPPYDNTRSPCLKPCSPGAVGRFSTPQQARITERQGKSVE